MYLTTSRATDLAPEAHRGTVPLGIASSHPQYPDIAGLGIRGAIVEVTGQRTSPVLMAGNDLVNGLRDEIVNSLSVEEAEVSTTDNPVVEMNGASPVGAEADPDTVVEEVRGVVESALEGMEPVEVGIKTAFARDVKVSTSTEPCRWPRRLTRCWPAGKGPAVAYPGLPILFTLADLLAT